MPFWKQPLVHFLLIGGLFYGSVSALSPAQEQAGQTIMVDRAALLTFIQQRTQIFEPDYAAAKLDGMDAAEIALLKADYVEEEALYREAKRLGLEREDYVIRRRMVQKMDYAAASTSGDITFSDDEVAAFYQANAADYATKDTLYFDHIFAKNQSDAAAFIEKIGTVPFTQLGQRFAYGSTFEGLTKAETADIFGSAFAEALWLRAANETEWQGPIPSTQGLHFVRLRRKDPAGQPPLANVRRVVEGDMRYEAEQEAQKTAIKQIIERYSVRDDT